ncbi:hypothetical protein HDV02_002491 [Globomyces sp. JEL0801]|nr:hypothetical protein HDV02_002491 [Globomyces sp. JEL0801]
MTILVFGSLIVIRVWKQMKKEDSDDKFFESVQESDHYAPERTSYETQELNFTGIKHFHSQGKSNDQ